MTLWTSRPPPLYANPAIWLSVGQSYGPALGRLGDDRIEVVFITGGAGTVEQSLRKPAIFLGDEGGHQHVVPSVVVALKLFSFGGDQ